MAVNILRFTDLNIRTEIDLTFSRHLVPLEIES